MTSVFLHLLNMSITAGWLVLAVVLLRLVFRRAPKWIHCLLWVLVAVRLLCPVSIESVLSLIPSAETVPVDTFLYDTPSIHSGVPVVDAVVNPVISNGFAPTPENSVNPMQVATTVAAYVWVAGIAAMLLYAVISTLRLRWQVREAAFVRENIWQCDRIATPFILGIFRPRIYLPTLLGAEETRSVVAHEQAHLSRKDHWWKPLGFLLLTVYWFNPLLWVGYILLCRDIEAACDQRVVRNMDAEGRKEYSRVLLACSAPRHLITACPLAFGETGVKSRIKSVLNYKKPAFWLVITAIVATVVAAVCLLTNPTSGDSLSEEMDAFLSQAIIDYNRGEHTGDAYPTEAHTVFGYDSSWDRTTVYAMVLYEEYYVDENGALQVQSASHCPTILTIGKEGDSYTLLEYWTPRDGENYPNDIRDRFPARHRGKAMDTDGYYKGHHATTYQKAREHFEPWQTALHQAILANNRKEGDNVFATESHRVYGATESEYTLTVYALVHYQEYQMVDGILTERSGSLVPTAITFTKNVDTYDLLQYWIPGDNWADSIREKFPEHLWDKALDYKNYPAEELKAESLAKAQAYFGVGDIFNAPLTFSSMNHLSKEKNAKLYANLPATNAIQYLPVIPMTNRGELDAFIAEYKEDMHFNRAEGDGLTPIHQMSFYDDAFFVDHVLLAVYYADGSCSVQPKIGGVVYEPTGLQVQVDVYEPEAGDTALGQWFMLCEVNRAAIPNVQNYTAVVRSHLPTDQYAAAFTNMVLEKDLPGYTEAWRTRLTDDAKTALRQLLADRQWKYTSIYSRTFAFIGAFDLDGSLYYVTVDYDAVYKDGKMFDLTDAEGRFFRDLYKNTVVANTFTGRVTQVTGDGKLMLMDCYDTDKFTQVWVSLQNIPNANPQVGEEYVVTHDQWVMETYPPRVTAVSITPVSSTPTVGTTTTTMTTTTVVATTTTKKTTITSVAVSDLMLPTQTQNDYIYGKSILYTAGKNFVYSLGEEKWFAVLIVRSVQELQSLCKDPQQYPARYNAEFFRDRALVLLHYTRDGYVPQIRVVDMKVWEQTLGIAVLDKKPIDNGNPLPTAEFYSSVCLEVSAADVANITTVEYFSVDDKPIPTITVSDKELAEKVYCNPSANVDFETGRVWVILSESVSADNHFYTAAQFSELFGLEIEKVEPYMYSKNPSSPHGVFRQMYQLFLPTNTKQAVLDAVKIIEQHPYVYAAEPSYLLYPEWD